MIGPKAPELLAELTDASLDKKNFPHMTCKVKKKYFATHNLSLLSLNSAACGFIFIGFLR